MTNNCQLPSFTDAGSTLIGADKLKHLIDNASAVSFDFFDTLFFRPLSHSEDAFDILGHRFGMPDFRERRRTAQAVAFQHMHSQGRSEITLEDIYTCFSPADVPNDELMRAEYELELKLIEPNPELFPLFSALLSTGKPVVITSDMYLPVEFFVEALRPHNMAHIPLFISADCNATKRDRGELFDIIADRLGLPPQNILHIGDNPLADVNRARERGFQTFHYRMDRELPVSSAHSIATSIAQGMLLTCARHISPKSYAELGFIYGGPANIGFLKWITDQVKIDDIDHVLFVSRDGYSLVRIAQTETGIGLPEYCYFLGSRIAFTLAAINSQNFTQFIPFLLSGSEGLAPYELLERIGVQPPTPSVMSDLGLGGDQRISVAMHELLAKFLFSYRWEIIKVCQRNRRSLFRYLMQLGIKTGSRVALVDVGWSGSTQEAFELAVRPMMELQVYGYYFCLANTPERFRRDTLQHMKAMVNQATTSTQTIDSIYDNRLAIELFFSAPHDSVIGLQPGKYGIEPVLDQGRGKRGNLPQVARDISSGIDSFAECYSSLRQKLDLTLSPLQTAWPLIELATENTERLTDLLCQLKNFDTWASSQYI